LEIFWKPDFVDIGHDLDAIVLSLAAAASSSAKAFFRLLRADVFAGRPAPISS